MAETSRHMRPSNKQRSRNKSGNNGNQHNQQRRPNMGNVINRVFESAGPDGKVRGTPQQIIDKYQLLARDAQLAGDRVAAESYLQHAEHYSRLLGDAQRQQQETRFNQEREEGQRGEEGPREDGRREDGRPQRFDDGFEPDRRQPAASQPVASGLAMIEPDDSFDLAGPIETPEGRRAAEPTPAGQSAPQPVVQMSSMMPPMPPVPGEPARHAEGPVELAEPQAQPAKRPRPRRRSKPAPEARAPGPAAQAE
jgi:hypothetical protein